MQIETYDPDMSVLWNHEKYEADVLMVRTFGKKGWPRIHPAFF